jgi:hypothetical protein
MQIPLAVLCLDLLSVFCPILAPAQCSPVPTDLHGTWIFYSVVWMGEQTLQLDPPELSEPWDYYREPAELRGLKRDPYRDAIKLTLTGSRYRWSARGRVLAEGTCCLLQTKAGTFLQMAGVSYFYCGDARSCAAHASKQRTSLCIYRLQGEELHWCVSTAGKLPTAFVARQESEFLYRFKRAPQPSRPLGGLQGSRSNKSVKLTGPAGWPIVTPPVTHAGCSASAGPAAYAGVRPRSLGKARHARRTA